MQNYQGAVLGCEEPGLWVVPVFKTAQSVNDGKKFNRRVSKDLIPAGHWTRSGEVVDRKWLSKPAGDIHMCLAV